MLSHFSLSRRELVLLFNGEDIVLQRIGKSLLINKDWGIWYPENLAEITLPYSLCGVE